MKSEIIHETTKVEFSAIDVSNAIDNGGPLIPQIENLLNGLKSESAPHNPTLQHEACQLVTALLSSVTKTSKNACKLFTSLCQIDWFSMNETSFPVMMKFIEVLVSAQTEKFVPIVIDNIACSFLARTWRPDLSEHLLDCGLIKSNENEQEPNGPSIEHINTVEKLKVELQEMIFQRCLLYTSPSPRDS